MEEVRDIQVLHIHLGKVPSYGLAYRVVVAVEREVRATFANVDARFAALRRLIRSGRQPR